MEIIPVGGTCHHTCPFQLGLRACRGNIPSGIISINAEIDMIIHYVTFYYSMLKRFTVENITSPIKKVVKCFFSLGKRLNV